MKMTDEGVQLIKDFEGFKAAPYLCPAGIPTIGYGTIKYPDGTKVTMGDKSINEGYACYLLTVKLNEIGIELREYFTRNEIELNDNQFSALVSFAYNLGTHRVIKNGSVSRHLKQKNYSLVPNGMKLYVKAKVKGKLTRLKGLVNRRRAECELYLKD